MSERRPPLKAYCYDTPDEGVDFIFARSEAGARARVARRESVRFEEAAVRPVPAFDRYAPGPVTDAGRHEQGWPVPCAWCEHEIRDDWCEHCWDECQENELPATVVIEGDAVYCREGCRDGEAAFLARVKAGKGEATAALLKCYPFVVPLGAWVGSPGECGCFSRDPENVMVRFKVPGGQLSERTADGNAFHNCYCHGCGQVWVARGDAAAFRALDGRGGA